MRDIRRLALVVTVMTSVAGAALAAPREGGRRKGKQPEQSLLDTLVRECKIPEAQQAGLKAKIAAREAALTAWDTANAEKVQAAEAAAKEARGKQDADAKKRTAGEVRALKTARDESAAEATQALFATLTDTQKAAWATYELYQSTVARFRRIDLTEDQQAKIKLACGVAAKEIGALDSNDGKAGKAEKAILAKLRWAVEVMVLTAEQRETITRKPAGRTK